MDIKNQKFLNTLLIFIGLFLGLIFGYFLFGENVNKQENYNIYLEDEEQVFRDKDGHKLNVISYKGQIYLPINELGSYLGYMTVMNNDGLYLYNIGEINNRLAEGFQTETYDGDIVTDTIFKDAKYTMFVIWATWCPDCKEMFEDWSAYSNYFKEKGVQLVSIVTDAPFLKDKEDMTGELRQDIRLESSVANFDYYLYADSIIATNVVGNSVFIPKFVIFDNNGEVLKITNKDVKLQDIVDYVGGLD